MKYTIDIAAKKAGITKNLIRAWELRYEILIPERTDTNRRLYSEEDIDRLKLLNKTVKLGYKISRIANLPNDELSHILTEVSGNKSENIDNEAEKAYHKYISELHSLVEVFNEDGLKNSLYKLQILFTKPQIITEIVLPFISEIGSNWKKGKIRIAHEHFITPIIKNFLTNLRESIGNFQFSKKIIVCTPSGQHHEIGALAAAVLISDAGYKVIYIGSNTPTEEIAASFLQSDAVAIAMSIIMPENEASLLNEMKKLRRYIENAAIIVGGNINYDLEDKLEKIGIKFINKVDEIVPFFDKILFSREESNSLDSNDK